MLLGETGREKREGARKRGGTEKKEGGRVVRKHGKREVGETGDEESE